MKYTELANDGVHTQPVYEPGKPIEYVAREFGLAPARIAKLASNENPFGPSPKAIDAVSNALRRMHLYPDGACRELRAAIAQARKVTEDAIIIGNGSNEIIELLGHVFLRPGLEVVMGAQSFIAYKLVTHLLGATAIEVPMLDWGHDLNAMRAAVTENTRLIFVASPNNPTGIANEPVELIEFAESLPDSVILCLDEAYAEYLERDPELHLAIPAECKVLFLRTFSKMYGLAGLRVGYGYGNPELIRLMERVRQPFNVNSVAQIAATAALSDVEFVEHCRSANESGRSLLVEGMTAGGYRTVGGSANFVLSNVNDGNCFFEALQRYGIIVRPLSAYGLPEFVRITIGSESENIRLLEAMDSIKPVFGSAS